LIADNLKQIYDQSKREKRGTYSVAKELAISKIKKLKNTSFIGSTKTKQQN